MTTEATVILTDVNDETPTFRSATYTADGSATYTAAVSESAQRHLPHTFLGSAPPQVFDYDQVRRAGRGLGGSRGSRGKERRKKMT